MNERKEKTFEEYKNRTGYGDLSAVSAISAYGAGFDDGYQVRDEIAEKRESELKEALDFYANKNHYKSDFPPLDILIDEGKIARKALENKDE